jgi:modulator of FtsH protease
MQYNYKDRVPSQFSQAAERTVFIRNVYIWLMGGFCVAAIGAFNAQYIASAMIQVFGHSFIWVLFALQFGSLIWANAVSRYKPLNRYAYAIFTFICGVFAGIVISSLQQPDSNIALVAFCMTAAMFLLLSGTALLSGKDFGFLRDFVIVGIGVMLLSSFLAIIFNIEIFDILVSAIAVIVCSAKILWDTSTMLRTEDYGDPAGFALSLFVGLYNIFISLIRLLSGHRD